MEPNGMKPPTGSSTQNNFYHPDGGTQNNGPLSEYHDKTKTRKEFLIIRGAQILASGLCFIFLMVLIFKYSGGMAWNISKRFNFHPLFMFLGLIVVYGNAILVYRTFPSSMAKMHLKILHGVLQALAIIFVIVALTAVMTLKSRWNSPHISSVHGWMGIITVILFVLQFVVGILTFLLPVTPEATRKLVLPFHIYFGTSAFVLAIATSLVGITMTYTAGVEPFSTPGVLVKLLALFLIIYGLLTVYLLSQNKYKRIEDNTTVRSYAITQHQTVINQ